MTQLQTETSEDSRRFYAISLEPIRNRQEARVAEAMRDLLPLAPSFCGCRLCVEDIYALALTELPAHYVQSGSLLVRGSQPTEATVRRVVSEALARVQANPNHPQ